MKQPKGELTARQRRFVQEYMIDSNATQAAIRAGYSPHTAAAQASRLLKKVNLSAEVGRRKAKQTVHLELKAEEVIKGLRREAKFKGKGSQHGARVSALTQLGRAVALFVDKVQLTHHADEELAELLGVTLEDLPK